jgi:hypothetical protein
MKKLLGVIANHRRREDTLRRNAKQNRQAPG